MRKPLIAGNWKMNGQHANNAALLGAVADAARSLACEILVCPPFVYLPQAAQQLAGTPVRLGAQNLSAFDPGAYTGEIAASMLVDCGASYVIVGHSERRALYGEDDATVAAKVFAAQRAGLQPILCVGETLQERESGATTAVVARQLRAVSERAGAVAFARAVVAYEPVWAIGTGRTASPAQAQEVHAFIRAEIAALDATIANSMRILYGGSVNASNASTLFAQPDVDGGLVGGASLQAAVFVDICRAAE